MSSMRISEMIDLLYGDLLNEGGISAFESIACDVNHVERGSIFFAFCTEDIPIALGRGAYAIVTDCDVEITDKEVAWIRVSNLQACILKLIRQLLIIHNVKLAFINEIEYLLLCEMDTQCCTFHGSQPVLVNEFLEFLFRNLNKKVILTHHLMLRSVSIDSIISSSLGNLSDGVGLFDAVSYVSVVDYSLLETRVCYENELYSMFIPHPMVQFLDTLICILKQCDIPVNLPNLRNLFGPVSVDMSLRIMKGGGARLLFTLDEICLPYMYSHVRSYASHLQMLVIIPHRLDTNLERTIIYSSDESIVEILRQHSFDVALLCGVPKQKLVSLLSQNAPAQPSLF